jgi:hypothetical protein
MYPINRTTIGFLVVITLSLGVLTPVHATLIGDSVSATMSGIAGGVTVLTQFTSPAVVSDPGIEFSGVHSNFGGGGGLGINLDVKAGSIEISSFTPPGGSTTGMGSASNFLQIDITDLNWVDDPSGVITGVTPDASNPTGSTLLGFNPNSISLGFRVSHVNNTYRYNISSSDMAAIPEPSTFVLIGIGLLGFIGIGVRRRQRG